ncbi:alpha/beta fold hydrolase [Dendronalium phyllosphericum]|uniref:alpha/beta fold hydrolase n=1 Tax=Dendronalium phyllosphericum TaxID=2840445 RepID=UPI001CED477B|nr:alpha/beta hydrolase [Dendronalium phyllosphericum]
MTLAKINIPVLVVYGDSDIATKPIASDRMVAELPQPQKVTIKQGRHMALMEQNRQFAKAVSAFCNGCS